MSPKKILIFIDWYLPGYKAGGPVRSVANLISHLKNDFEFYVITRNTDYCETAPYQNIKSDEWNTLSEGENVLYLPEKNITGKKFKEQIQNIKPDFIFINGIYSYKFSILPLLVSKKFPLIKTIISARGMFAQTAIGVKKTKKIFFLKAAKMLRLYRNIIFHATNENEKSAILSVLGKNMKINIAPNLPKLLNNEIFSPRNKEKGRVKLISVARIAPEKNTKFALEILFSVKGNLRFDLYGAIYNKEYWNECMEIIKILPDNIKVNYCGSIENTAIPEKLKNYHFLFMPTLGENFGHSIFESLASGCPVIITDKTPWKNLAEKKIGWDISLEEKNKFVETIEKCIEMEQSEYNEWSQCAFNYAKNIAQEKNAVEQNRKLFL